MVLTREHETCYRQCMSKIRFPQFAEDHPIDTAARFVGGRSELATRLAVSVAAIGNWKVRGVPIEQCPRIERVTQGVVARKQLRPDDWQDIWPELAQSVITTHQPAARAVGKGA